MNQFMQGFVKVSQKLSPSSPFREITEKPETVADMKRLLKEQQQEALQRPGKRVATSAAAGAAAGAMIGAPIGAFSSWRKLRGAGKGALLGAAITAPMAGALSYIGHRRLQKATAKQRKEFINKELKFLRKKGLL